MDVRGLHQNERRTVSVSARLSRVPDWEKLAREAKFQPGVMADLCPVSLRQLQRFFKDEFNMTPGQWARELRCRLARQLISQGWSNKAVVVELEFANEAHLCHEFKSIFGVSPQTFSPLYGTKPGAVVARFTAANPVGAARAAIMMNKHGSRLGTYGAAFRQECRV